LPVSTQAYERRPAGSSRKCRQSPDLRVGALRRCRFDDRHHKRGDRPVSKQTQGSNGLGHAATQGRATDSTVEQGLEVEDVQPARSERPRKRGGDEPVRGRSNDERAMGRGDAALLLARGKLRRVKRHRERWKCWERISASAAMGRTCPSRRRRGTGPVEQVSSNVATRWSGRKRRVWRLGWDDPQGSRSRENSSESHQSESARGRPRTRKRR
jgi:hypothetical protein